jgi:hypothetical protein
VRHVCRLATMAIAATLVVGGALVVPAWAEPGFSPTTFLSDPAQYVSPPQGGSDISCASTTSCTSVLTTSGSVPYETSAPTTEMDGSWSTPAPISPPFAGSGGPATMASLTAVACTAPGSCTAVGSGEWECYLSCPLQSEPLVVTATSGVWGTATSLPVPASSSQFEIAGLSAIHCTSPLDCVALGFSGIQLLAYTESSGTWSGAVELPSPPATPGYELGPASTACAVTSDCTAIVTVRELCDHCGHVTYAWHEHAGAWSGPVQIGTFDNTTEIPFTATAIACPGATRCLAVGEGGDGLPAYAAEVAGRWGPPRELALPRLSPVVDSGAFVAIACPTATLCVASAEYRGSFGWSGGAVTWSKGHWGSADLTRPLPGQTWLGGISCPTASVCVIDGVTTTSVQGSGPGDNVAFADVVTPIRRVTEPGPPRSVTIRGAGTTAITARWTPPLDDGGAPVLSYAVHVDGTSLGCTTAATTCTIAGLDPSRSYTIEVTDRTAGGSSRPARSNRVHPGS